MTKILAKATKAQPSAAAQPAAGRKVGYGRVSTEHQGEAQQRAQLEAAGCTEVITETISGSRTRYDRPGLAQVLDQLEAGDTLVICKLDRLARSLQELLEISADLQCRGIHLQVLDQAIDTASPVGRLLFQMLGAISEFERALAVERTRDSVAHRRATGGNLGGRKVSYTAEQQQLGQRLQAEGHSISQVAKVLGLSKGTAHRMLTKAA